MKIDCGWTGKILRVDLSQKKSWTEPTEPYVERFIGGIGLGYKLFWDEVSPDTGAFDAENRLIFATGPLTGTLAPAAGRFELVSKSPRSYPNETVTRSGMGGYWGPELKFAGYDALVVQGKSEGWVNLWIHDERVEYLDANAYQGADTHLTQIRLRKELDRQAKILCIGPAGEKMSRLAVILSETSYASGRSGFGAVMGSKRLKAIVVRGNKPLKIHDPQGLIEVSQKVRSLSAQNTSREKTTAILSLKDQKDFINKYRKKNTGCFGCALLCFAHIDVPGSGQSATHCINYFYHPYASKYYGSTMERDQAVSDGYILANRYGLDTFEFWHMVNFLKELHAAGVDLGSNLPLEKIGSREFIRKLLQSVTRREGIGDLLAEGCARAADQIKNGWDFCGKYFPSQGSAAHGPVRNNRGVALQWALDSRGPLIDGHSYIRLASTYLNEISPYTLSLDKAKTISHKFFGSESAIDPTTFEGKAQAVVQVQNRSALINVLVVCDWVYPCFHSFVTNDRMGDTSLESQLLAATTGYAINEEELNHVGERVWNLSRAIMVREGRSRAQDTLHESFFQEYNGEQAIPRLEFEKAKDHYYYLRGWDKKTGWPTRKTLDQLQLTDIEDDLDRRQLLPR